MQTCDAQIASSPVNLNTAADTSKLDGNNIRTVGVQGDAVRWFDPDFSLMLQRVSTVYVCLSARTKSDCFIERIVLRCECKKGSVRTIAADSIKMIEWRAFSIRCVRPSRERIRYRRWAWSRRGTPDIR